MEGKSNEPFSEAITYDMALSVSHYLGTEIPIPRAARRDCRGGWSGGTGVCGSNGRRGVRTGRAGRPRAPSGHGAAEGVDIEVRWNDQGSDGNSDIEPAQEAETEAVLGQSLLGTRILCRHNWAGRGEGPHVCAVSGKAGTNGRATRPGLQMTSGGGIVYPLASSGGKAAFPPYGGNQSHPLRGWILYYRKRINGRY